MHFGTLGTVLLEITGKESWQFTSIDVEYKTTPHLPKLGYQKTTFEFYRPQLEDKSIWLTSLFVPFDDNLEVLTWLTDKANAELTEEIVALYVSHCKYILYIKRSMRYLNDGIIHRRPKIRC